MLKIKDFRVKKGLTQEQLAKKIGVTRVYITLLETGNRTPSFNVLQNIANTLGISIKQLF